MARGIGIELNYEKKRIDKFLSKLIIPDVNSEDYGQCWIYKTKDYNREHNQIRYKGQKVLAHRYSYAMLKNNGQLPELRVLHKCNNPKCVNPNHLYEGSAKDNAVDRINAKTCPVGENNGNARLSVQDVVEIKEMIASGKYKLVSIAAYFNVHPTTIQDIKRGRHWTRALRDFSVRNSSSATTAL